MVRQLISLLLALLLYFPQLAANISAVLGTDTTTTTETTTAETDEDPSGTALDYSNASNWCVKEEDGDGQVDVFLIAHTVDNGTAGNTNMSLSDTKNMAKFDSAIRSQGGIYDSVGNIYAPYYRQATLASYEDAETEEQALASAYEDISAAFEWYLENCNDGRPIILAGFSQGADMAVRLIKEYFGDKQLRSQLVAVYAIGWAITEDDLAECSWLKMAQGESDTGVVISFECEAEGLTSSSIVPAGVKMLSINPLTWSTDNDYADASLNVGSCFVDTSGKVYKTATALTGAYIDPDRGTLVCPDLDPDDYPTYSTHFTRGQYHLYDYQLFYRNLQENVSVRLAAYFQGEAGDELWVHAAVMALLVLAAVPQVTRKKRLPALEAGSTT